MALYRTVVKWLHILQETCRRLAGFYTPAQANPRSSSFQLLVLGLCAIVGVTLAAKIKIPSKNRNDDLFKDDEFTFPVEDNKDPSNFTGNVMKAGILMAEVKNQGKGNFKYA